jgi:hypothetical protein
VTGLQVDTIGSPADTWGRSWSPNDFANANFRLLVGHSNNQGTFQVDFCAVRVTYAPSAALTVSIDIKPGSFPNSINPRSRGGVAVAVLTTGTFDASSVDSATLRFGATGLEAAPVHAALEDVDGNGSADLVLHFATQDTGIQCGDTSASLTGTTVSGQAIQGSDSVNTVGCK